VDSRSFHRVAAAGVALMVAGAVGAHALYAPVEGLLLQDDAYYYFGVARHLSAGHGFTFDGLHPTNGFHPLWLGLCTAIWSLVPGEVLPLRVASLVEAALLGAAAAGIVGGLGKRVGLAAACAGALWLAAAPGSVTVLRSGMESAVLAALLVWAWRAGRSARWGWLALACGLLALARLEAACAGPIFAWAAFRGGAAPRRLVRWSSLRSACWPGGWCSAASSSACGSP
jgi:hypothetical protein